MAIPTPGFHPGGAGGDDGGGLVAPSGGGGFDSFFTAGNLSYLLTSVKRQFFQFYQIADLALVIWPVADREQAMFESRVFDAINKKRVLGHPGV
jgi:hypothetical protein